MSNKLVDSFMTILGFIGSFGSIFNIVIKVATKTAEWYEYLSAFMILFLSICIIFIVYVYKRRVVNIYSMLNKAVINNKVHALRELIMVERRRNLRMDNFIHIKEASFKYIIRPNADENNYFDVNYMIHIVLGRSKMAVFHKVARNRYSFYLIGIESDPLFEVKCSLTMKRTHICRHNNSSKEQKLSKNEIVIRDVTTSGKSHDHIKTQFKIYEVILYLPQDKRKIQSLDISYTINKNIKNISQGHNFFIIPKNYGTKIGRMGIEIESYGVSNCYLEIQELSVNKEFEPVESFVKQLGSNGSEHFSLLNKYFRPGMNSGYFIKLQGKTIEKAGPSPQVV